jgi:hypothetical protein
MARKKRKYIFKFNVRVWKLRGPSSNLFAFCLFLKSHQLSSLAIKDLIYLVTFITGSFEPILHSDSAPEAFVRDETKQSGLHSRLDRSKEQTKRLVWSCSHNNYLGAIEFDGRYQTKPNQQQQLTAAPFFFCSIFLLVMIFYWLSCKQPRG